jgi:hypothetical protein
LRFDINVCLFCMQGVVLISHMFRVSIMFSIVLERVRLKKLATTDDLEQLLEYYLVWYKPNPYGISDAQVDGSVNYRFDEYSAKF